MMAVADRRRLVISRITIIANELNLEPAAECWQNETGKLYGSGMWYDLLVPRPADLEYQAKSTNVSTLECLRMKLSSVTYLKVEWKQNG